MAGPSTIVSWASIFRRAFEHYGFDADELFQRVGIDKALLNKPDARIPHELIEEFMGQAISLTKDPTFGILMAKFADQTAFQVFGLATAASDSLKDAFERIARYCIVVSSVLKVTIHQQDNETHVVVSKADRVKVINYASIDFTSAVLVRFCRARSGKRINPLRVDFEHEAPSGDLKAYNNMFRCPVQFGQSQNRVVFEKGVVDEPLYGVDPVMKQLTDQAIEQKLRAVEQGETLSDRISQYLRSALSSGEPTPNQVASQFHLSLRTLQRKLAEEGQSYRALYDNTRRDMSLDLMSDPSYSITEIAFLLGFSDLSSFSRTFKRWMGVTPKLYREQADRDRDNV